MKNGLVPQWFYTVYDAIIQGVPLGPWPSVMQQPCYWSRRYRFVYEALKESKFEIARKSKLMGVIDVGRI